MKMFVLHTEAGEVLNAYTDSQWAYGDLDATDDPNPYIVEKEVTISEPENEPSPPILSVELTQVARRLVDRFWESYLDEVNEQGERVAYANMDGVGVLTDFATWVVNVMKGADD